MWQFSEDSFIRLDEMIHFPHSSFLPHTTHMFPFLHRVLGLWIPLESSLGSRAKTASLSLLYPTGVKSTNRLLWPNVIKQQPGSGQFTARQLCLSRVSCISTEQQLSILLLKKISLLSGLDWLNLVEQPHCEEPASLISTAGGSVEVMSWDGAFHALSQCGVPPAALHRRRAKCVCHNTSVQMVAGHHTQLRPQ